MANNLNKIEIDGVTYVRKEPEAKPEPAKDRSSVVYWHASDRIGFEFGDTSVSDGYLVADLAAGFIQLNTHDPPVLEWDDVAKLRDWLDERIAENEQEMPPCPKTIEEIRVRTIYGASDAKEC